MENPKDQIIVVAGEASGDLHAAHLVRELKYRMDEAVFSGVGGENMQREGVELYETIDKLAVVGFIEVLKHYGDIKRTFRRILDEAQKRNPKAVILVDYPGFNLRLAKELKKRGIKVIYYISPQVWAWNEGRVRLIKKVVDKMIVLFAFEKAFYARHKIDVAFVGHPLIETVRGSPRPAEFLKSLGLDPQKITIGILPGSRRREIEKMLPVMLQTAETLYLANKGLQFLVMRAPTIEKDTLSKYLKGTQASVTVVDNQTYAAVSACEVCMVTSGTATLETAILQKPMVVIYKTSFFSWLLAKLFIRISCIGLVNVVAGKKVVPECIQFGAAPGNIARHIKKFLTDDEKYRETVAELGKVKAVLGGPGASMRAAEEALNAIASKPSE